MKIIAHRGFSAVKPENTMASFKAAWATGCAGVELDVRLTADGYVVVFHDADGVRMVGSGLVIENSSWAEIARWRIGDEPVPELGEVLNAAPRSSLTLVELKTGSQLIGPLLACLRSHPEKSIAILTFDEAVARLAASLNLRTWLNVEPDHVETLVSRTAHLAAAGIKAISFGWSEALGPALINQIHGAGLEVAVWTVNDARTAMRALRLGIDYLMTDDPGHMLEVLSHEFRE